jgi:hypothetical protein
MKNRNIIAVITGIFSVALIFSLIYPVRAEKIGEGKLVAINKISAEFSEDSSYGLKLNNVTTYYDRCSTPDVIRLNDYYIVYRDYTIWGIPSPTYLRIVRKED